MAGWFSPVFEAAGMSPDQVHIILVGDHATNAFVAGGANIFFYTGLLQKTDGPDEVIAVMAHELGHISGGHLIRAREAMERASYESILGAIVGVGAAIATGDSAAAGAVGAGASGMAQRRFLATSRVQEASADQAAIGTLAKAGLDSAGLQTFLEKLQSEELLPADEQSAYVRTHPLTRDRVDAVSNAVQGSPNKGKPLPAAWIEQHARMKAKLLGFMQPEQVAWIYDDHDQSIPAQYARAIADYRQNRVGEALLGVDALIALEPQNPYFHELRGQMLFEFGRVAEALPSYEKAIALAPRAALIRIALAHARMETAGNDTGRLQKSIADLKTALRDEPRSALSHRLLATAYGRMGNDPLARLHLAEEALLQRKKDYAKEQAETALKGLPQGSPEWLQAQDVLNAINND